MNIIISPSKVYPDDGASCMRPVRICRLCTTTLWDLMVSEAMASEANGDLAFFRKLWHHRYTKTSRSQKL